MHYVMSDIHGRKKRYDKMLDQIGFSKDDTLYILGDAIDRGEDGGILLLDFLTQDNICFLLGNHEHMLMQAGNNRSEFIRWMINGAEETILQMEEMGFNGYDFLSPLEECPVYIPNLPVGENTFSLVHAQPPAGRFTKPVFLSDLTPEQTETALWSRYYRQDQPPPEDPVDPSHYYLIGHTPVTHCTYTQYDSNGLPVISRTGGGHVLNLDCGCAADIRLGCLRLEDMKEFYT